MAASILILKENVVEGFKEITALSSALESIGLSLKREPPEKRQKKPAKSRCHG